jgi:hypothetical protein
MDNLRQGNWLIDYILSRLDERVAAYNPKTGGKQAPVESPFLKLRDVLRLKFNIVKQFLPRPLVPRYFDEIVRPLFRCAVDYALRVRMGLSEESSVDNIHGSLCICGPTVSRLLLLTSLEVVGVLGRTPLLDVALLFHQTFQTSDDDLFSLSFVSANKLVGKLLGMNKSGSESKKLNVAQYGKVSLSVSPSLAAGLPHFSHGFMRNWGRDTFIAFRGLLLVPGRFSEAAYILRGYGSVMRHGLIPNLMGGGENPRYNARDAVWWWAQAVQEFCAFLLVETNKGAVPTVNRYVLDGCGPVFPIVRKEGWKRLKEDDEEIDMESYFPVYASGSESVPNMASVKEFLKDAFPRKFDGVDIPTLTPADSSEEAADDAILFEGTQPYYRTDELVFGLRRGGDQVTLLSLLHECLQAHASGIHFREWNAGQKIDDKMTDNGFNVDVVFDYPTGFVFGGNSDNCGTWMDKMGESKQAKNFGVPATPRDGLPIEIAGMVFFF